jgi:hypothetical protein
MAGIVEYPENSDLLTAIKLAKEVRDENLDYFVERIQRGALEEDRKHMQEKFDNLIKMNENIKLLEDALVLVYAKKGK